jgi:uncharacterized protein (DUF3084 family)
MTELRLNTTREERMTLVLHGPREVVSIAADAIVLEDELDRAREERNALRVEVVSLRESLLDESEERATEVWKERDALREELASARFYLKQYEDNSGVAVAELQRLGEELASARLVVDACLSQQKDRWDLETMAMKHDARFGGRES